MLLGVMYEYILREEKCLKRNYLINYLDMVKFGLQKLNKHQSTLNELISLNNIFFCSLLLF